MGESNDKRQTSEARIFAQQQEQALILNHLLDAVITIDERGIMLSFNRSAQHLFGYDEDEAIGSNVSMLMGAPHREQHDHYIERYLSGGEAHVIGIGREVEGRKKDGTLFPIRLSVAELSADDSNGRRFVGSCHDLTAEKEKERLLARSSKMDALGKLVGGIAHDFNNILGIMLGYTEMLQANIDKGSPLATYAQQIERAGERATELTEKLLSFSSMHMKSATTINLNDIIRSSRLMLEKAITPAIDLQLKLDTGLGCIWCEKVDLENMLLNIAINASHAMEGRGTLTISTENIQFEADENLFPELSPGNYVKLSIVDTGCGMDEETQQRIFDPFFTTKGELGTGLGLAQAYGMMQRCGGAIRVYSTLGEGSRFDLYFQRFRVEGESTAQESPILLNQSAGIGHILLIDDEEQLRHLFGEILQNHGYRVTPAENGDQALDLLSHHEFDLVLSDIVMPGMGGTELAAIIQQRYPGLPIQLMSGFSDDRHGIETNDELYRKRLQKPVRQLELLARIDELLHCGAN